MTQLTKRTNTTPLSTPHAEPRSQLSLRTWLARIGNLFPRNGARDAIATTVRFEATPAEVWRAIMFYEEVPGRPSWMLRMFLPRPLRTEGDKKRVGAHIHCDYEGGYIVKRMTVLDGSSLMRFEVIEQQLGLESCITMIEGSYELHAVDSGCEVVLTTHYRGHARPRWLWRWFERYLAHGLHRHILEGMRVRLAPRALCEDRLTRHSCPRGV